MTIAPEGRGRLMIAGWTLHEARHRLERDKQSVKLEPKTTELLGYLARHAGEPLSREQLLREVWPEVVVSDEALTNAVNKIRRAFGDDRQNPKIIETIPKMGYRLIASVAHPFMEGSERHGTTMDASAPATSRAPDSEEKAVRKLAAILYADVAGYSRLMEEDEEGTHRRVSEYLDVFTTKIQNHHGKVVHFAGDAILAEFPTVSNALSCAASVQHELAERNEGLADEQKVQFRIGVNLGEIIVDRDDIYGDGVNIAARLEALADPGGICISEAVRSSIGKRLPFNCEFLGEKQVKNIVEPVRAYQVRLRPRAVLSEAVERHQSVESTNSAPRRWPPLAAAAAIVMIALLAALMWLKPWAPREEHASAARMAFLLQDKPAIAVLPFDNQSEDKEQEYFADGITEDLITDLSRVSGLNVIARNSVFVYKDMAPKPQDVAMQMGASHVLEGSVRKSADQVRINVKLIDTSSGINLWAERFDGSLKDVFKLQDHVTTRVAAALAIKLTEREREVLARDRTTNVEALQNYFIGKAYYSASKQENEASRRMFRRAIDLDPSYGQAYAALALTYLDDWRRGWSENPEQAIDKAVALAQQAITVDDTLPEAHFALGFIHLYAKGQHDRAIAEAKTALALNPNHAGGYTLLASAYFYAGYPEQALPLDRKAIQLDPGSSFLYYVHLGRHYYFQGRYQEALDAFKQAEERNYNYIPNHLWLAATYSQLGQPEDAFWEADQVLTLDPDFSIQRWMMKRPYKNSTHREQLLKGLRKAGLPY